MIKKKDRKIFDCSLLRSLMAERNISGQMLSDTTGRSLITVSCWRRGHSQPGLPDVEKMADYFNVKTKSFY